MGSTDAAASRILTVPNVISFVRILLIPVFVALIVDPDTVGAGIALLVAVSATDWVDGTIARRTGQVSELGKVLDPVADRLAIGAGLIALMIAGALPVWAGALILVRDGAVLVVGVALLAGRRHLRIDVRFLGKVATFGLMVAVPCIAWGHEDLPLAAAATALGWIVYAVAVTEYYAAALLYVGDIRSAIARSTLHRD
jgi:cardiolipin synthase (CMP-forming)